MPRTGRRMHWFWMSAALSLAWAAPAAAQRTAEEYEAALAAAKKKAIDYLYSKQSKQVRIVRIENQMTITDTADGKAFTASGNSVRVGGRGYANVYAALPPGWFDPEPIGEIDWLNAGGTTALVTLALLAAGETPATSPRLQAAIDCLAGIYCADMGGNVTKNVGGRALKPGLQGTYALALHACVLEQVYQLEKNPTKKAAHKRLLEAIGKKVQAGFRADGGYDYFLGGSDRWDMSNTQYAMLALWAVNNVTNEVSIKALTHLNNFYVKNQSGDGGFPYTQSGAATPNMTAGAVASLYLMLDILHTRGNDRPTANPYKPGTLAHQTVEGAAKGLEWFSRNFKPAADGYLLYSTERIGMAGGQKRFGPRDWFRDGVDVLLKTQGGDGRWAKPANAGYTSDDVLNTAFCLLFIAHGNAPILVNKLRWGGTEDYSWANYPRDCANLARWFNRTYEQAAAWQVVDFSATEDWPDAPLLYVSSASAPPLDERQIGELRSYVDRGGTLLCVACGPNGKAFAEGVREIGRRMYPPNEFPDYQMAPVPPTHPVYAMNTAQAAKLAPLKMFHMHNGARSFLFLVPDDIAHVWASGKTGTREELFFLINNLRNYATDKALVLAPKLRPPPPEVEDEEKLPAYVLASIKYTSAGEVTVTDYEGNPAKVKTVSDWNSVPLGWKSLNPYFIQKTGMRIDEVRGVELTAPNLRGYPAIHMAGRKPFELSDAEKAGLKVYLEKGGVLIVEDVGPGRTREFLESAKKHLAAMFPKSVVKQLADDHPLFTGAFDKSVGPQKTAAYSRSVRLAEPDTKTPDLSAVMIDGRPAVLLSRFDFSSALSGAVYYERFGFQTDSARHLAMNMLMWAKVGRAKEK